MENQSVRSSREDTERHRQEIIEAAAQLFREKGANGVSVPELMQAVGMTHGGFYRHFASKDELVPLAYRAAFDQIIERLGSAASTHDGDQTTAWNAMVTSYLSPEHRDSAGRGCAAASLAGDAARTQDESLSRKAFEEGIERMLRQAEALQDGPDARDKSLVALSTLIGALLLARGTDGQLSDAFLDTARTSLKKPERKS
jgi:TetR/AcrR family transcriptional regulator, transcriptional repressor for nem operon